MILNVNSDYQSYSMFGSLMRHKPDMALAARHFRPFQTRSHSMTVYELIIIKVICYVAVHIGLPM
jgi:hypothetical protein